MTTDRSVAVAGLVTSLLIDNIRQGDVGRLLDAIRDAGFQIEINVTPIEAIHRD